MIQTDISAMPIWQTAIILLIAAAVYFMGIHENRKLHINQLNATVNIDSKMKRIEDIRKLSVDYLREAYDMKAFINTMINKGEFENGDYDMLYKLLNNLQYKRDELLLYFSELDDEDNDGVIRNLTNGAFKTPVNLTSEIIKEGKNNFREKYNNEFNLVRNDYRERIGAFLNKQWNEIYDETKRI
ncbi:hypothetical protein [Phocicoccus pinnipedialis]|uniref:Uncharacterized protein n=1 Tax=Phocicoccus pinnipedialis TaxID=110845 RepID=A0A6V7R5W8_9BACL|nr:hypothetical protein [Jeotgalicoccus pinnipedialis]MBP1939650.1 hypothetical protein [Jeotgalicoccus pinnipedialis]CAD2072272.1 hypothetical protein JEOPIN946_00370 [Jeotgalicoccus pinnipedialis]